MDLRMISLTRKKIWKVQFLKYMQLRTFTQQISRKMTRATVFWNMLLEHWWERLRPIKMERLRLLTFRLERIRLSKRQHQRALC